MCERYKDAFNSIIRPICETDINHPVYLEVLGFFGMLDSRTISKEVDDILTDRYIPVMARCLTAIKSDPMHAGIHATTIAMLAANMSKYI